jgi:glucoamylase
LNERGALDGISVKDMVRRALRFIAREGPATAQDRWEEDPGVNTFTLAIAIAALVEGSTFLDSDAREFALRLADTWNEHIEDWAYIKNTPLARKVGVEGYFIRTAPKDVLVHDGALAEHLLIKNRAVDPDLPADEQIATDFLQLVRYGLRRADDPKVLNTLKAIDRLLKTDTPSGPVWHRYNGDGYGEHDDGSAFDGTGRGRGWPLLTGERGHYALVAGEDPVPYLNAMAAMTGPGGLLPEQVWDSDPITERRLTPGKPSGSAMPLVWAHSEFIKLCYSSAIGFPVDRPIATWNRYQGKRPTSGRDIWGPRCHLRQLRAGTELTVAVRAPARVHWGINDWKNVRDVDTKDTGLGVFVVDLPTADLASGETIQFTFFWLDEGTWEGRDYEVLISP